MSTGHIIRDFSRIKIDTNQNCYLWTKTYNKNRLRCTNLTPTQGIRFRDIYLREGEVIVPPYNVYLLHLKCLSP